MKMLPELAKWQEEYPPWLWAAASHELETQNKREMEGATWAPSFHLLSSGPRANSLLWAPCHAGLNPLTPWAEINKGCLCQVFLSQWQKEMNAGLETWLSQEGHLLYGHDNWCSNTHHPSTKPCMVAWACNCRHRWTLSVHCLPGQNSRVLVKGGTISRQ